MLKNIRRKFRKIHTTVSAALANNCNLKQITCSHSFIVCVPLNFMEHPSCLEKESFPQIVMIIMLAATSVTNIETTTGNTQEG